MSTVLYQFHIRIKSFNPFAVVVPRRSTISQEREREALGGGRWGGRNTVLWIGRYEHEYCCFIFTGASYVLFSISIFWDECHLVDTSTRHTMAMARLWDFLSEISNIRTHFVINILLYGEFCTHTHTTFGRITKNENSFHGIQRQQQRQTTCDDRLTAIANRYAYTVTQ